MRHRLIRFGIHHPRVVAVGMGLIAVVFPVLVAVPSLWPDSAPFLHGVAVDTDPENMLNETEAVRVFHNDMKRVLSLHEIVVVGVVNTAHPEGVFNVQSLGNIYALTEYAKTLRGDVLGEDDPGAGVVEIDIIAPSTVDNIESGGLGVVRFEWLMASPPETEEEALAVRSKAQRLPFLDGTLVSEDGQAIALYLPLTSKDLSYKVAAKLREKIREFEGEDAYHITGLPVAEDTFGVEMFKQMAISAPLAMAIIFVLMLVFFHKLVLIVSPMIIALVSVIVTMGMLIVTGNTIHIMSSMIPVFIMPIAVLDSVHILSEFFDRYQKSGDRRKTIEEVMESLYTPMLYTSLTSAAGFGSLAFTPIPPVQVFGVFIAVGIIAAWFFSITFVPAYVMFIPERMFTNFGLAHREGEEEHAHGVMSWILRGVREFTYVRAKWVLAATLLLAGIAVYGISRIEINDNPTRWFTASHPIRVADRVLNDHFAGTYMAYLAFRAEDERESVTDFVAGLEERVRLHGEALGEMVPEVAEALPVFLAYLDGLEAHSAEEALERVSEFVELELNQAEGDAVYGWEELDFFLAEEAQRGELFKQPDALEYIARVQEHLERLDVAGKSNSLPDIVKTVHRELFEGEAEYFSIPETAQGVAQCLITFESSHRPHDLYHFVTPDFRQTSVWVQLKSGDNKDMSRVVDAVEAFVAENPPPPGMQHDWFGLTYINVVWQQRMVSGMLEAFAGSFLVVLLMMVLLFRSGLWGLLAMIPLTVTIGLIYGVVGLVGKDYDMPVAVLSSLTLGLAVDFAIHFLVRSRGIYAVDQNWRDASIHMFGEPARAISRNVIVISVGFLPLLAAPLVPYKTVSVLLASILFVSGGATLFTLPAIIRYGERWLFPKYPGAVFVDRYWTYVISGWCVLGLIVLTLEEFSAVNLLVLLSLAAAAALAWAGGAYLLVRRRTTAGPADDPMGSS